MNNLADEIRPEKATEKVGKLVEIVEEIFEVISSRIEREWPQDPEALKLLLDLLVKSIPVLPPHYNLKNIRKTFDILMEFEDQKMVIDLLEPRMPKLIPTILEDQGLADKIPFPTSIDLTKNALTAP